MYRSNDQFFVCLRQLATHPDMMIGTENALEIVQCLAESVRRLEKDAKSALAAQDVEPSGAVL